MHLYNKIGPNGSTNIAGEVVEFANHVVEVADEFAHQLLSDEQTWRHATDDEIATLGLSNSKPSSDELKAQEAAEKAKAEQEATELAAKEAADKESAEKAAAEAAEKAAADASKGSAKK